MGEFTHFNKEGNAVMVDVHAKDDTYRVAVAADAGRGRGRTGSGRPPPAAPDRPGSSPRQNSGKCSAGSCPQNFSAPAAPCSPADC